mmetsp:Transcript_11651/g.24381  ORF Transcript_11651/g.24381 Transcript_11651/m.24381 type:complete len:684 (+) Transcript_11651:921-2972(+)
MEVHAADPVVRDVDGVQLVLLVLVHQLHCRRQYKEVLGEEFHLAVIKLQDIVLAQRGDLDGVFVDHQRLQRTSRSQHIGQRLRTLAPDVVVAKVQAHQHAIVPRLLVLGVKRPRQQLRSNVAQFVAAEVQGDHGLVGHKPAVDWVAVLAADAIVGEVKLLQRVVPREHPLHGLQAPGGSEADLAVGEDERVDGAELELLVRREGRHQRLHPLLPERVVVQVQVGERLIRQQRPAQRVQARRVVLACHGAVRPPRGRVPLVAEGVAGHVEEHEAGELARLLVGHHRHRNLLDAVRHDVVARELEGGGLLVGQEEAAEQCGLQAGQVALLEHVTLGVLKVRTQREHHVRRQRCLELRPHGRRRAIFRLVIEFGALGALGLQDSVEGECGADDEGVVQAQVLAAEVQRRHLVMHQLSHRKLHLVGDDDLDVVGGHDGGGDDAGALHPEGAFTEPQLLQPLRVVHPVRQRLDGRGAVFALPLAELSGEPHEAVSGDVEGGERGGEGERRRQHHQVRHVQLLARQVQLRQLVTPQLPKRNPLAGGQAPVLQRDVLLNLPRVDGEDVPEELRPLESDRVVGEVALVQRRALQYPVSHRLAAPRPEASLVKVEVLDDAVGAHHFGEHDHRAEVLLVGVGGALLQAVAAEVDRFDGGVGHQNLAQRGNARGVKDALPLVVKPADRVVHYVD